MCPFFVKTCGHFLNVLQADFTFYHLMPCANILWSVTGSLFNVLQTDATFWLFSEYLLPAGVFTVQNINTARNKFKFCYKFYYVYYAVSFFLSKSKTAILNINTISVMQTYKPVFVIQYCNHSRLLLYFLSNECGITTPTQGQQPLSRDCAGQSDLAKQS